ncbi:MAG TPA: prepilin-type N-terminal cleavage/methylation domain-containing protein [Gammaproteobacteria bacterium]
MRRDSGYTLLEVMLAVALLGILAGIGIPAYRGVVDRTNNNRAIADIGELSLHLYRWETNIGAFPPSLAAAGLAGRLDPWGRPYFYLELSTANPGDVRKDKNLVPINTDFDLYSAGKDGVTARPLTAQQARDDIVRASNGAFIGLAADY